jgi:polyhydroxybutyrate depolymerase
MSQPSRPRSRLTTLVVLCLVGLGTVAVVAVALRSGIVHHQSTTQDYTPVITGARPAPIVYRPPGLSRARKVPLIVGLYGDQGCPQCMEGLTKFEHLANRYGFVVAYPGSTTNPPWNSPGDLRYISSLIDQVKASQNIDPRRVYVTGFSAGGRMAYQVGCRLSGKLAGIAVVSSVMRGYPCKLSHPVSELTIDGGNERTALYGNSSGIPPAIATAARWRALNGCPPQTAQQTSVLGPVTQRVWSPCADASAVGLYVLSGGHHTWPGTYGLSPSDPDAQYGASLAIWNFFSAHPGGSLTTPSASLWRIAIGPSRQVVSRFRLGESVRAQVSLVSGQQVFAVRTARLSAGASVSLILLIPAAASSGGYQLKFRVQDAYGRVLRVIERITL